MRVRINDVAYMVSRAIISTYIVITIIIPLFISDALSSIRNLEVLASSYPSIGDTIGGYVDDAYTGIISMIVYLILIVALATIYEYKLGSILKTNHNSILIALESMILTSAIWICAIIYLVEIIQSFKYSLLLKIPDLPDNLKIQAAYALSNLDFYRWLGRNILKIPSLMYISSLPLALIGENDTRKALVNALIFAAGSGIAYLYLYNLYGSIIIYSGGKKEGSLRDISILIALKPYGFSRIPPLFIRSETCIILSMIIASIMVAITELCRRHRGRIRRLTNVIMTVICRLTHYLYRKYS